MAVRVMLQAEARLVAEGGGPVDVMKQAWDVLRQSRRGGPVNRHYLARLEDRLREQGVALDDAPVQAEAA